MEPQSLHNNKQSYVSSTLRQASVSPNYKKNETRTQFQILKPVESNNSLRISCKENSCSDAPALNAVNTVPNLKAQLAKLRKLTNLDQREPPPPVPQAIDPAAEKSEIGMQQEETQIEVNNISKSSRSMMQKVLVALTSKAVETNKVSPRPANTGEPMLQALVDTTPKFNQLVEEEANNKLKFADDKGQINMDAKELINRVSPRGRLLKPTFQDISIVNRHEGDLKSCLRNNRLTNVSLNPLLLQSNDNDKTTSRGQVGTHTIFEEDLQKSPTKTSSHTKGDLKAAMNPGSSKVIQVISKNTNQQLANPPMRELEKPLVSESLGITHAEKETNIQLEGSWINENKNMLQLLSKHCNSLASKDGDNTLTIKRNLNNPISHEEKDSLILPSQQTIISDIQRKILPQVAKSWMRFSQSQQGLSAISNSKYTNNKNPYKSDEQLERTPNTNNSRKSPQTERPEPTYESLSPVEKQIEEGGEPGPIFLPFEPNTPNPVKNSVKKMTIIASRFASSSLRSANDNSHSALKFIDSRELDKESINKELPHSFNQNSSNAPAPQGTNSLTLKNNLASPVLELSQEPITHTGPAFSPAENLGKDLSPLISSGFVQTNKNSLKVIKVERTNMQQQESKFKSVQFKPVKKASKLDDNEHCKCSASNNLELRPNSMHKLTAIPKKPNKLSYNYDSSSSSNSEAPSVKEVLRAATFKDDTFLSNYRKDTSKVQPCLLTMKHGDGKQHGEFLESDYNSDSSNESKEELQKPLSKKLSKKAPSTKAAPVDPALYDNLNLVMEKESVDQRSQDYKPRQIPVYRRKRVDREEKERLRPFGYATSEEGFSSTPRRNSCSNTDSVVKFITPRDDDY